MNDQTTLKPSLLPVWLWFWLGVYIVSLPNLIGYLGYLIQDSLAQYYTWSVEVGGEHSSFELLRAINLYEIAAYIVVLAGVFYIILPHVRGQIIERKFKLATREGNPAIQEITAFVQQKVPHIQVKANLILPTDQLAITYPLGFRKPALGVFNKLVMMWRSDRETAEAVLMHEIAHIRQGDFLVLGAGSLFETTVSWWIWISLLLVFIPVLIYTGGSILAIGPSLTQMGILTTANYLSNVIPLLINCVLTWIGEFMSTFSIFILPLAGIWSSELLADRLTATEVKSNETMQKAMALLAEKKNWKEKIFAGATHPPASLRRFMIEHTQSRWVILLLTIFFPLMYLVKLLVMLCSLLPSILTGDFVHQVSLAVNTWAQAILPIFIAMAIWLLLWRWLRSRWDKLFISSGNKPMRSYLNVLMLSIVVSMVATHCGTPIPESHYKIGQVFQVGDAQVIVYEWKTLTDSPDLQGTTGKKIIQVDVAVRNNGKDNIAPLVSCARLKDSAGKEYHYSFNDSDNSVIVTRDLPSGAPKPGEKTHGIISFLVDQNSDSFQFIYIANPPLDMTRAAVALTNDPADRISPTETLPDSITPGNHPDITESQTLALKDFTVSIIKVEAIDSKVFAPDKGNKLIALDLAIKNTGSETFKISNIFMLELEDENGITYSAGALATAATGKKLPAEDLAPGKEVNLTIGLEIPETLKKAWFQYILDDSARIGLAIP